MPEGQETPSKFSLAGLFKLRYLRYVLPLLIVLVACYSTLIEPRWIRVRNVKLSNKPTIRIAHLSDLHYKGTRRYLEKIVAQVNQMSPDIVCITGDFIEQPQYQAEVISILAELEAPILGISGNHEDWGDIDRVPFRKLCLESGGKWIDNASFTWKDIGFYGCTTPFNANPVEGNKTVLLCHYPKVADNLGNMKYDLILAGHTHGGQVRVPIYGALIIPYNSGVYEMGIYRAHGRHLHVSPGIGNYFADIRFNCRPEITVIEL